MGLITNRSHSLYCKANIRQLMLNFTLFISPWDHHSASPSLPASLPPILPLSLYFLQCLHVEVKLVQQLRVELGRRLLVECGNFTQIKYRQHRERQVCRGEMFQPVSDMSSILSILLKIFHRMSLNLRLQPDWVIKIFHLKYSPNKCVLFLKNPGTFQSYKHSTMFQISSVEPLLPLRASTISAALQVLLLSTF